MKKTTKYALASTLTLGAMALAVAPVLASGVDPEALGVPTLTSINAEGTFGQSNLNDIITGVIQVILAFLGVIAVLIILWGGFIWMTAQGEPDKVGKAKNMIYSGIIGLVIIFAAYAIAAFVLNALKGVTGADITGTS